VLDIRDYDQAPYLVLATRNGLVKKTRLADYDSPRSGGLIAVNLRDGDELVAADLASSNDDLLLVSRNGQSARFHADDETLRPLGRATSGVTGMRFRDTDALLSLSVIEEGTDPDVFVVFENGLAKRTAVSEWSVKGRGILGVAVAKITEKNGVVVGALTVDEDDEVLAIMGKGNIVRSSVAGVTRRGRNTQGMRFVTPSKGDVVVAVARSVERAVDDAVDQQADGHGGERTAGLAQSADEAQAGVDAVPSELTDLPVEAVEAPDGAPAAEAGEIESPGGNE
jgi:DNA gyrase subunit A